MLHVLAGLDAVEYLRYELAERFGQTAAQLQAEFRQLGFQTGTDFAIVHGGVSGQMDFLAENTFYHESRAS